MEATSSSNRGDESMEQLLATSEERILARVSANHLFLAQFEPFRASLQTLYGKNRQAAAAMLRAVVSAGGSIPGVLYSHSVPSASHLAWMCVLELEEIDPQIRGVDNMPLVRVLAEVLLLLDQLEREIAVDIGPKLVELRQIEGLEDTYEQVEDTSFSRERDGYFRAVETGFLREVSSFYLSKLEGAMNNSSTQKSFGHDVDSFRDKLQAWLEFAAISQPHIVDSICENISRQKLLSSETDAFGSLLQKQVQIVHLSYVRSSVDREDVDNAVYHVKFFRGDFGVPEADYSEIICSLATCIFSQFGFDDRKRTQKKLASLYEAVLSSKCTYLLSVLEDIQDKLQKEDDNEPCQSSFVMAKPFWRLQQRLEDLRKQGLLPDEEVIHDFMRDMFHYARVEGKHILESATSTALAAIKAGHLQIAADVLVPFPRLRPLVAAMAWDLLPGKTTDRRRLMELLWLDKQSRDIPVKQLDEASCVEYLCEQLCFNLELAYFVADLQSGTERKFGASRLIGSKEENIVPSDTFAANLVLECLAISSPLRVIFYVLPNIKFADARSVIKMLPVCSSLGLADRQQDLELLHMHYGLQSAVSAILKIAEVTEENEAEYGAACLALVQEVRDHLESISNPVCRIWMLRVIVSFLSLKGTSTQLVRLPKKDVSSTRESQSVITFVHRVLALIRQHLPLSGFKLESRGGSRKSEQGWAEAWEDQNRKLRKFAGDWEWRLSLLKRLSIPSNELLKWKSALTVLHCAPSSLLNMCIQNGLYDLAKEAVHRFSLRPEDAALLQLAEWTKISPNEAQSLSFHHSLLPVSRAILCTDAAITYSPSTEISKQLIDQARAFLSEPLQDEAGILSVLDRVLARLTELLEQPQSFSAALSGAESLGSCENARQGPRKRALIMLCQIIEDAQHGKGQFLSGKLHNLVKAFGDEDSDDKGPKTELGLGLGLSYRPKSTEAEEEKEAASRVKAIAYLSAFILYVATIGDIFDGADTTHDFNFFSLLYERPGDLLTRLVFEKGCTDEAAKVAEVMGSDLVHQVISACVPPVLPPRMSSDWGSIPVSLGNGSADDKSPVYHLDLETTKYLATLSPVRAILASVFCDKELTKRNDFAIEQAERFPTLQRWIQMQANLQRLCDSPIFSAKSSQRRKPAERVYLKRRREYKSEEDEVLGSEYAAPSGGIVVEEASQSEISYSLLRGWEDEYPYQEAVEGLIEDGKLVDALAFSDRWLKDGAPDKLLQLLIERGEDSVPSSNHWQASGSQNLWNNSWQYCIRLRDKRLAATLALKYLHRWDLDAAIDVLTMCSCHLPADDVLTNEVLRVKRNLQQYSQILREDAQFRTWQEVESLCERDPEGLALRLAGKGAVAAALNITESCKLSDDLRRELQGRQLVKLLTADPISGGGPAEALRFLGSLHRPEDALPVAMAAMEQLPNLHSKQLLVHFMLKRQLGLLSEKEHARMDRLALGLKMLGALPLPWQQRCSGLHEHPQLILETLLMWKQFQAASQLLEAFPSLRNDKLIISYASKAINVPPPVDRQTHYLASRVPHTGSGNKLTFGNGRDRRGFSWTSRDTRNKIPLKDAGRKRKNALPPSQKAAWEAMAGYQEDRPIGLGPEGYEKLTPLTMADEWVLTGDPAKDEAVRNSHRYESAPNFVLFKSLLSLCFDQAGAAKSAVELCVSQIKSVLSVTSLPHDADPEAVERAFHAAGTFVQGLLDARTKLHKILGNAEASEENSEAATDTSSHTKLLAEADIWLNRVELLHSLLGSGVTAAVEDVSDEESALLLRDRLIQEERYGMGVYTCTKCKIDVFPVWEAWGYALLRIEHYDQARLKFKKALQLYKDDPSSIVQKIVDTMESCPPADVSAARSLYIHMAKSVSSASDDSLSADSYLNVLYIPTFTRAERSKKSSEDVIRDISPEDVSGPWSNLDGTRFEECRYYMKEYARQRLLPFMFRHGHYGEACRLLFPLNGMPPVPASSGVNSKLDSLATEYGSIDDLCDLCVSYGAIPNLEDAVSARISASSNEDAQIAHHTSAALTRICNYFETHRHFNHLYRFQVIKKDYIAAGLCCIQLFLNTCAQDQALRHLERAKAHFEEGLLARQENVKSAAKAARGKSPSEKLTDEELIKFSARVTIQMEVVRAFNDSDGPPWKRSLFGNPNENDTFKRRCEIAEALVERNFDLAFQIIYDFGLPAVYIYAGVAAALAEKRKYNNLVELLRNIKGTVDEEDWDQIVGAAISVYANNHRERPDRLIEMLSSNHRKVLACVICGRLKSAFQIASRSGNIADVQWVLQQARMTGALPVEDMCKQWLARVS